MSALTISEFFEHVLEAPLNCVRWSWGARRSGTKEVYLRCWSDEIERIDGKQYVQVQWLKSEVGCNGRSEREDHLNLIRDGWQGWLIVAFPKDKNSHPRKINGYNNQWKFKLGSDFLEKKNGMLLLPILDKEPLPKIQDVRK